MGTTGTSRRGKLAANKTSGKSLVSPLECSLPGPRAAPYHRRRFTLQRLISHPSLPTERRRKANFEANNGKERKDLYTDNWDGDSYKGSQINVLTVLAAVTVLAPLIGLYFAFQSYGVLWG
jgi:hypothetical protein